MRRKDNQETEVLSTAMQSQHMYSTSIAPGLDSGRWTKREVKWGWASDIYTSYHIIMWKNHESRGLRLDAWKRDWVSNQESVKKNLDIELASGGSGQVQNVKQRGYWRMITVAQIEWEKEKRKITVTTHCNQQWMVQEKWDDKEWF
jgi:hypothetical protein